MINPFNPSCCSASYKSFKTTIARRILTLLGYQQIGKTFLEILTDLFFFRFTFPFGQIFQRGIVWGHFITTPCIGPSETSNLSDISFAVLLPPFALTIPRLQKNSSFLRLLRLPADTTRTSPVSSNSLLSGFSGKNIYFCRRNSTKSQRQQHVALDNFSPSQLYATEIYGILNKTPYRRRKPVGNHL